VQDGHESQCDWGRSQRETIHDVSGVNDAQFIFLVHDGFPYVLCVTYAQWFFYVTCFIIYVLACLGDERLFLCYQQAPSDVLLPYVVPLLCVHVSFRLSSPPHGVLIPFWQLLRVVSQYGASLHVTSPHVVSLYVVSLYVASLNVFLA
jgi:hypothetical protein